jgi:hypothetical protein
MSTARFDTLQNAAGSKSVPVSTVVDGSAKAWVNFNGTGTVSIRSSFNVSSITDNGVGDYTVNFATAMADANYAVSAMSISSAAPASNTGVMALVSMLATQTTTQARIAHCNINANSTAANIVVVADSASVFAAVYR